MSTEKKRGYPHVKELGPIIEEMFARGRTKRETANEFELPGKETVKDYLKRKRRAEKQPPQSRPGRPRKRPITEKTKLTPLEKRCQSA